MPDSQEVKNSSSGSTPTERADFHRKIPYDPAVLKRQKLWSKEQLADKDMSGRIFSRVGAPGSANGRDSLVGTTFSHQGDRATNKPDSKHKEGDTQKYNSPSESHSHSARSNNGQGVQDRGDTVQYASQKAKGGDKGLDDAAHGRSFGGYSDSAADYGRRSHGERDGNVTGRDHPVDKGDKVEYPAQPFGKGGSLPPAQSGQKWNSDSRHHAAADQHEPKSVKLSRGDNTLNRRMLGKR